MMQPLSDGPPHGLKVAGGLIIAPLVAALCLAIYMPGYDGLTNLSERIWRTAVLFYVVGGLPSALVLGLPTYLAFRNRLRPSLINCMIAGALVAGLPWLALGIISTPDTASIGGRSTVVDGWMTLYGWIELAKLSTTIAVAGAIGGLVFWAIVAPKKRHAS